MPRVVRCYEPRKNAKRPEQCGGFVSVYPDSERYEFVGIVAHSRYANPSNSVWVCSKCGRLHEYRRAAKPTGAA